MEMTEKMAKTNKVDSDVVVVKRKDLEEMLEELKELRKEMERLKASKAAPPGS